MDQKLKAIVAELNKKLGEDTVVLGSDIHPVQTPRCTTGSLSLDVALGGGWPMNQWSELIGYESAGKTVVALKTIAANHARDPDWTAVWVDAENALVGDPEYPSWLNKLEVDPARLIVVADNGMESVYQSVIKFLASREVDAIVIDSLPALVPEREDDATMEDLQVGLGALLTGKFFRKQQGATRRSLTTPERPVLGLMINQWRDRIGVVWGDPRTTPGGRGKNFFYAVRLELKRDEWIEDGELRVGQVIKAHTLKNKTAVPHRTAVIDFYFDDFGGFRAGQYDAVKEVVALAIHHGVVGRAGAYYSYQDEKWQGKPAMLAALREEVDVLAAIRTEVTQVLFKRAPRIIQRKKRP